MSNHQRPLATLLLLGCVRNVFFSLSSSRTRGSTTNGKYVQPRCNPARKRNRCPSDSLKPFRCSFIQLSLFHPIRLVLPGFVGPRVREGDRQLRQVFGRKLLFVHSLMAMTVSFTSCSITEPISSSASADYPVIWTREFNMADLLANSVDVNSQKELALLMNRSWYASFEVQLPATSELRTLSNCNDYLAINSENPVARQNQESNALLELMVICEATRLLSKASAARSSKIPPAPLHAHSPDELPKALALVTSESEKTLIQGNQTISRWGEVNSVSESKRISPDRFEYYSDASVQMLSLIGRGDLDSDGVEDILVRSTDSVEGGSYFDMRLFVLTVDHWGEWQVISEY